ncbi:GNAT family N-acetyltransferase [Temperatibacter marinus]|uniref:GNAT family N-acetyltransferase n=1 Tax=Temperatibacter marinus TaxID=1456591 RepID=A0AA52EKU0_9PROT|nr:GNAT family N-acetyltransferase [Temperatibacter marinus]WND03851.1 GNAT family N-acetyltransferase [Temperatibacter marinus]
MKITYRPSTDLPAAAGLTFSNMRAYYEHYSAGWDVNTIIEQTADLENVDILVDQKVAGLFRLHFDREGCNLRDLQIEASYQSRGIGQHALDEIKRRAELSQSNQIKLRVFKMSPAVRLYERNGYHVITEDDRFYNMALCLSGARKT